jgi:hypothetical protein
MWSTNRLEYLIPTLETSKKFIDWGDHDVDGIFIDDMPKDRDDVAITQLANSYGYDHVILHETNKGITETWRDSYKVLEELKKDYDFVWHQEDDLIINQVVKIDDLINDLLEHDEHIQVSLGYQTNWYSPQTQKIIDFSLEQLEQLDNFYRVSSKGYWNSYFNTSFSLTKAKPLFEAIRLWDTDKLSILDNHDVYSTNKIINESSLHNVISAYNGYSTNSFNHNWCTTLYDNNKENIIEHIGEWSWGQRVPSDIINSGIPDIMSSYQLEQSKLMAEDPTQKINSRTWKRLS